MSKSYDYSKVYISEAEVQEMLEGIGYAIEALTATCDRTHEPIVTSLKRSREIGSQILCDVSDEDEDNWPERYTHERD
jgi:hypothetical protein